MPDDHVAIPTLRQLREAKMSPRSEPGRPIVLSIRDVEEATGINRGRLSIIERGVAPNPDEDERIRAAIAAAPDLEATA